MESRDKFIAGSWCLQQKRDFEGLSGVCGGGKGEVGCEVVKEHCLVVVPTYYN